MKKQIIGTVVAALILFIWQFISWGMVTFHKAEMQYTPQQDAIMESLNSFNLEEGTYFLPNIQPGQEAEQAAYMEKYIGKPWARISYHKEMKDTMGMNMVRGLVVDLVTAFLIVWLLMQLKKNDFKTCVLASLAVGAIGYMTIPYLNTIWFEGDSMGYLIDAVLMWGIVGAWLGWWLNRAE